jgi:DNA-binding MarR family transcriptional regulator
VVPLVYHGSVDTGWRGWECLRIEAPEEIRLSSGMKKSPPREAAILGVVNAVRSLFHELKVVVQEVHGGSPLAGGRRGVLVNLLEDGPQTVPELARRRPVSRQHIQALVNELLRDGLVVRRPNPAHKRSKLTAEGRKTIRAMLERETELLRRLELDADTRQLTSTAAVLEELRTAFRDPEWRSELTEG